MQGDFLNPGEHLTNAKGEVLCMSYDKVARHIGVDGREVVSTAFSTRDGGAKEGTPGTCNATHQEMAGTDVGGTTYTGTTDAERDASCCARCEANPACEFWVRATDSSDCWLKKGFGRSSDSASRRGGFRGGVETYDRALRYSDKGTIRVPGKELWGITASKWSNDHYKPGSDKAFHSFLVGNCVELDQVALKRVVQHDYASHGAVTATKTCAAASTCGAPIGCTIHKDHKLASVHPKVDAFLSGLKVSTCTAWQYTDAERLCYLSARPNADSVDKTFRAQAGMSAGLPCAGKGSDPVTPARSVQYTAERAKTDAKRAVRVALNLFAASSAFAVTNAHRRAEVAAHAPWHHELFLGKETASFQGGGVPCDFV